MAYFSNIPNFSYISRVSSAKNIGDYIAVKNLFKRVKLRDDVYNDLTYFIDYNILGDDRPDDVSYKLYDTEDLDWLVLTANNIINVYEEWPMTQQSFDTYLLDKYGSYDQIEAVHHYETWEVKDGRGAVIVPQGLHVPSDYSITFLDGNRGLRTATNITYEVTNQQYETDLQEKRRRIRYLRPEYLNLAFDDIRKIMEYKKGSTQFVSRTLKKGDNLRIFSF